MQNARCALSLDSVLFCTSRADRTQGQTRGCATVVLCQLVGMVPSDEGLWIRYELATPTIPCGLRLKEREVMGQAVQRPPVKPVGGG